MLDVLYSYVKAERSSSRDGNWQAAKLDVSLGERVLEEDVIHSDDIPKAVDTVGEGTGRLLEGERAVGFERNRRRQGVISPEQFYSGAIGRVETTLDLVGSPLVGAYCVETVDWVLGAETGVVEDQFDDQGDQESSQRAADCDSPPSGGFSVWVCCI